MAEADAWSARRAPADIPIDAGAALTKGMAPSHSDIAGIEDVDVATRAGAVESVPAVYTTCCRDNYYK